MTLRVSKRRVDAKLDRTKLRAAYELYQGGHSVDELAEKLWRRYGYSNERVAATCIYTAFKIEGWPLRNHSEANALAVRRGRANPAATLAKAGAARDRHYANLTHCVNGHELTGDNVYLDRKNGKVQGRRCRACRKAARTRHYEQCKNGRNQPGGDTA